MGDRRAGRGARAARSTRRSSWRRGSREGAPIGIRQAKAAIRGAHRSLAEGLAAENALYEEVLVSEDRREGFRAFAEKRPPRFEGR